jgi:putative toxin-antitoxin system antitoxin component (TIGR02293 family)
MATKSSPRGARARPTHLTVHAVRDGLDVSEVEALRADLQLSQIDVERYLGIPRQTFARRKLAGRLNSAESDRVVRFRKLSERAATLLSGDPEAAVAWLKTPLATFDGETPLTRAMTELGAEQVNDLILQLEHGIAV